MHAPYTHAAHSYRLTGQVSAAADPHQRLELTLAGILTTLARAQQASNRGDVAARGQQIGQAMTLISILRSALDHAAAPALTQQLDRLYDYCNRRLLAATAGNAAALDEVRNLMVTLKGGWDAATSTATRQEH